MPLRRVAVVITMLGLLPVTPAAAQQLRPILFTSWGRLCSVRIGDAKQVCLPKIGQYDDIVWSPDHKTLVTAGGVLVDGAGKRIGRLNKWHAIRPVWSPDGQHIFAIDYDIGSAVRRWDQRGGSATTIPVEGGVTTARRFQMVSFSPSGRRAALVTWKFDEMVIADCKADKLL